MALLNSGLDGSTELISRGEDHHPSHGDISKLGSHPFRLSVPGHMLAFIHNTIPQAEADELKSSDLKRMQDCV